MGRPKKLQYLVIDLSNHPEISRQLAGSMDEAIAAADDMQFPVIVSGQSLGFHELEKQTILADRPLETTGSDGPEHPADAEPEPEKFAIKHLEEPNKWINDEGNWGPPKQRLYYDSKSTADLIAERVGGVVIPF